jgi:predicted cupin superfamily sugar epimerase
MIDLRDAGVDAALVIAALDLRPHPEGGHYRETWRDSPAGGGRGAATSILFLLRAGESSHWHRVDAAELWIWQAGAPLTLRLASAVDVRLGPGLADGETLHRVVPSGVWQSARPLGAWSLCCCVVAPAFRFEGFELAPPGWEPDPQPIIPPFGTANG